MKRRYNYGMIRFTTDIEANKKELQDRDYHTLCVLKDALGTVSPEKLAKMAERGETFMIDPNWPCCRGEAWYRDLANDTRSYYPALTGV